MQTVKNHVVTYPNRYTVTNINNDIIELTPNFGTVIQAGTKLDADFFNGIKGEIELLNTKVNQITPDTTGIDLTILETQIEMQKALKSNKVDGKFKAFSFSTNSNVEIINGQLGSGYLETL